MVGAVIYCAVVAACSLSGANEYAGDRKVQKLVRAHFDLLERTPPFETKPPSAALTVKGRRDACLDPNFDRKEPAVWRRYSYEGSADTILSFYRSTFTNDGWNEVPYSAIGAHDTVSTSFSKDLAGWPATVDLYVGIQIKTIDITAADRSVHVCPK
jgi:hypothetical protein